MSLTYTFEQDFQEELGKFVLPLKSICDVYAGTGFSRTGLGTGRTKVQLVQLKWGLCLRE